MPRLGDRESGAHARVILAQVATARHDAARPVRSWRRRCPFTIEIGDGRSGAVALAHLGDLAFSLGECAAAGDYYLRHCPSFWKAWIAG